MAVTRSWLAPCMWCFTNTIIYFMGLKTDELKNFFHFFNVKIKMLSATIHDCQLLLTIPSSSLDPALKLHNNYNKNACFAKYMHRIRTRIRTLEYHKTYIDSSHRLVAFFTDLTHKKLLDSSHKVLTLCSESTR